MPAPSRPPGPLPLAPSREGGAPPGAKTARGVANAHLAQLRRGIMLTTPTRGDKTLTALTLPCEVTRLGSASFRIVLTEGRNQQIRRMCKALSLGEVKRLHRVSVAGINLDGREGPGEWAALDEREWRRGVRKAAGSDGGVRRQRGGQE